MPLNDSIRDLSKPHSLAKIDLFGLLYFQIFRPYVGIGP
jgi:hypothetical protein